jgi:hypothetical protein
MSRLTPIADKAVDNPTGKTPQHVVDEPAVSTALLQRRELSEEIGYAAHIYDRLDSEMLHNPLGEEIGI